VGSRGEAVRTDGQTFAPEIKSLLILLLFSQASHHPPRDGSGHCSATQALDVSQNLELPPEATHLLSQVRKGLISQNSGKRKSHTSAWALCVPMCLVYSS
jgi:hypothetical protein